MLKLLRRARGVVFALAFNALAIAGPAAMIAAPLALSACAGNVTPSQATTDVQAIANGLSGIVAALKALPGNPVPAATLAKIQTEIDAIKADAASIGTAVTPSGTIAQDISAAVAAIVPLATPFFPAAPAVAAVINAAVALVPVVLAAVGIQAQHAAAAPAEFSPDQARLVLRDAAINGVH